jgi:hypothetical protein
MDGKQHESQAAGMPTLRFHGYGGGSGSESAPLGKMRWAGLDEGHEGSLLRQEGTAPIKGQLLFFGEESNHAQPSRQERLEQSLD